MAKTVGLIFKKTTPKNDNKENKDKNTKPKNDNKE